MWGGLPCSAAQHGEKVQLPVQVPAGVVFHALEDALHRLYLAAAGGAHAVKSAGLDEALHRPAVEFVAPHPLAEVVQA